MKDVEANDYVRRLSDKRPKWIRHLKSISIRDYEGISTLDIDFVPNINILVGANGTGKSRVLKAIFDALSSGRELCHGGSQAIASEHFDTDGGHVLVNPGKHIEFYKEYFLRIGDINETLLNGASSRALNLDELAEINYILLKSYTEVIFYEVQPGIRLRSADDTEISFSEDIVPFFVVTSRGLTWNSVGMGTGEYAAFYMWWLLMTRERYEILLLEEPETYLSYKVQERLTNHIAKVAYDKSLFMVISTHSYPFIAKFPEDGIVGLLMAGQTVKRATRGKVDILSHIGAPILKRFLFVVEDRLGEFIIEYVLGKYFPDLYASCFISTALGSDPKPKSGAAGVYEYLANSRHIKPQPLIVIGVYDHDQENQKTYLAEEIKNCKRLLLPSKFPMDYCFIEICRSNAETFEALNANFFDAFFQFDGADFHDHLKHVAECTGLELTLIWRTCLEIWIRTNDAAFSDFKENIRRFTSIEG